MSSETTFQVLIQNNKKSAIIMSELNSFNSSIIVVIGSCSVDFTTYAPRLPMPGETLHGTKFSTSFGGKGANQCVASAKLGGNTYMIARVGDDQWGIKYKEHLADQCVNISHFYITPSVTTGIAQISVAESGENQIVIVAGANKFLDNSDVVSSAELIKQADVLIGQLETPFETTLAAFKLNTKGVKLLNAAPARSDIQEILPYCTILCVNEVEAAVISGMEFDMLNITKVLKKLLNTGCETVIITLGQKGAAYLSKNDVQAIHVYCKPVKPVDTTGAGDAFVGALATFMVEHKEMPLHQVIGAACEVASISVTKEGTQTSYPTKIDAFNKEYEFIKL